MATSGLTSEEAARLLRTFGPNRLPPAARPSLARRVLAQLKSPLIYLLLFAVAFDAFTTLRDGEGWPIEGTVIAIVLALNAALGVFQEYRAEAALGHLAKLASPLAWVVRDQRLERIAADELVPGDRVRVEAGERVPADGAFAEPESVSVDESVLTGESVSVEKGAGDPALSGTLLVRGKGFVEVTHTGTTSTMGKLAEALVSVQTAPTPLERQLARLGTRLVRWVGALALAFAVAGLLVEGPGRFEDVLFFAVALAVAAVPEGMPAVVTLTLSLGVQRMAKRKAVVRRLAAVEALGSVTVIATDKTGTLTENRMAVQALVAETERATAEALAAMIIANDADDASAAGDPLELALLDYARRAGLDPAAVRARLPRIAAIPFDSAWRYMRVTVRGGRVYWKGAPEVLIARADLEATVRDRWEARARAAAANGLRVIALGTSNADRDDEFELLGLALLVDPPRPEVPAAVQEAIAAGVRVIMITGDHPATAQAIADRVGIDARVVVTGDALVDLPPDELRGWVRTANVFARVGPDQKLAIVEALEADGEIVAVTGDGVNDAPALKRADVGIAMGQRGSDVAREVSDLVLLDDNFATIVAAIEEGRNIFENIRAFLRFSFSTNIALVLLVIAGAISSYALHLRLSTGVLFVPLTALQILWINFLGDGPPGLAFAFDRNTGVMAARPRRGNALIDRASARYIAAAGALKGLLGIAALIALPLWGVALVAVQTVLFQTEAIAKVLSTYTARGIGTRVRRNPVLHVAVGLALVLQGLTLVVPGFGRVLGVELLGWRELSVIAGLVAAALVGQAVIARAVRGARRDRGG